MNKKRVSIFYGHLGSNYGDVGITIGTIEIIKTIAPDIKINVIRIPSKLGDYSQSYIQSLYDNVSFRFFDLEIFKEQIRELLKEFNNINQIESLIEKSGLLDTLAVKPDDFVIYNGGEHLFSYNHEDDISLISRLLPVFISAKISKNSICLPASFGPFNTEFSKEIISKLFLYFSEVFFREDCSKLNINKICNISGKTFTYGPDPGFFIPLNCYKPITLFKRKSPTVTIVPRIENIGLRVGKTQSQLTLENFKKNDFSNSIAFINYSNISNYIYNQLNYKLVFLAQSLSDLLLCEKLRTSIDNTHKEYSEGFYSIDVIRPFDFSGYLYNILTSNLVITSRFHSIVFNYLVGNDLIGIYNKEQGLKIPGLMKHYNKIDQCYENTLINSEKMIKNIKNNLDKGNSIDSKMIKHLDNEKNVLLEKLSNSLI